MHKQYPAAPGAPFSFAAAGYRTCMSDDKQNIQGVPNGERSTDADTASGGAPEETGNGDEHTSAKDVDPDSGTDENGDPVDNPSGG
jgi:hypothetical protein